MSFWELRKGIWSLVCKMVLEKGSEFVLTCRRILTKGDSNTFANFLICQNTIKGFGLLLIDRLDNLWNNLWCVGCFIGVETKGTWESYCGWLGSKSRGEGRWSREGAGTEITFRKELRKRLWSVCCEFDLRYNFEILLIFFFYLLYIALKHWIYFVNKSNQMVYATQMQLKHILIMVTDILRGSILTSQINTDTWTHFAIVV